MSNIGFALVGILGLIVVLGINRHKIFLLSEDARPYLIFFIGVTLVSIGSAYYHWEPSNERLLWDRLPMSIAFMAFTSAVIADRINPSAGNGWLLLVLILFGIVTLIYWNYTEQLQRGDLRFYAFVQFYPVIMLPFILYLFPNHYYISGHYIVWVLFWYGLSKLLEYFDAEVFEILDYVISGHTLKHIAAAISAFVVVRMLLSLQQNKP